MNPQTVWRFPPTYIVTTFGCREYLRRRGFITEGELIYTPVGPKHITIADIQSCVVEHFYLKPVDMVSARRSREVARPRQIAMYLAKQLTRRSLPEIGRRFGGRDHTTVIHAVRQVQKLMGEDPEIAAHVKALMAKLDAAPPGLLA